jgi:hypothetical protein
MARLATNWNHRFVATSDFGNPRNRSEIILPRGNICCGSFGPSRRISAIRSRISTLEGFSTRAQGVHRAAIPRYWPGTQCTKGEIVRLHGEPHIRRLDPMRASYSRDFDGHLRLCFRRAKVLNHRIREGEIEAAIRERHCPCIGAHAVKDINSPCVEPWSYRMEMDCIRLR